MKRTPLATDVPQTHGVAEAHVAAPRSEQKIQWTAPRLRRQSVVSLTQNMTMGVVDTTTVGSV